MSDDDKPRKPPPQRESNLWAFLRNLVKMPRWQRTVMSIAVLLASAGAVGQVGSYISQQKSDAATQPAQGGATLVTSESPDGAQPDPPAWQRHSPAMAKAGFGCIAGFILGWIARLFFKTVALITTLGVMLLVGLSYFKVDTSEAEKKYKSAMEWVSKQGESLYEKGKNHLPGSTSLLGLFMGFRRKTVK
jgi:uncharacterized membrane protein (Fun14 family)